MPGWLGEQEEGKNSAKCAGGTWQSNVLCRCAKAAAATPTKEENLSIRPVLSHAKTCSFQFPIHAMHDQHAAAPCVYAGEKGMW